MQNNLKFYIKKSGMKQYEIAEILEITPEYLSMIVRNEKQPSFSLAKKIVDLFDTSIDDIFLGSNSTKCAQIL